LLLFTFVRSGLILLSPFILLWIVFVFKVTPTLLTVLSSGYLVLSLLVNLIFGECHFLNVLVSFLIFFLPLMVLLSRPKHKYFDLDVFMRFSSMVLIVVDISGYLNFTYTLISGNGLLDDSFSGLYGRSGLSMHTLSIINFIYFAYYFDKAKTKRAVFFLLSGFMCFYGLGLMLFIMTFGIAFVRELDKKYLKYILATPIIVVAMVLIAQSFNPRIFSYMQKNIDKGIKAFSNTVPYALEMEDVKNYETVKTPRKILAFRGASLVLSEPINFMFGTSPGTYNSRTSFLLNGEYTKNPLFKKIQNRPYYAERDIYPLWNDKIVFQYNDGTRNEPFSSFLSLLVEYGILQTIIIFSALYIKYRKIKGEIVGKKFFVRFIFLFGFFNILSENYIEYPEFMLLFILIVKSLEVGENVIFNGR